MITVKKNKNLLSNLMVSFLTALYSFRAYFYGYILGDEYDTRLMISQHEHWYRLIFKNGVFRDTLFFYPKQDALGFTDSFLIPSFFYVPLRAVGSGILQSWSIATFIALFIGYLGWLLLFTKLIDNFYLRALLFFNVALYPAWIAQFEFFPNALGYMYISWLLLLFFYIFKESKNSSIYFKINIYITVNLLLMLTSWYPALFFILINFLALPFLLIKERKKLFLKNSFKLSIKNIAVVLINSSLSIIWLLIYLPKFLETKTYRNWFEVMLHSLSVKELFNPLDLNNGLIFILLKNRETGIINVINLGFSIGLTISILLSLIIIVFNFKFWKKNYYEKDQNYKLFTNYILIPSIVLGIIFIKITEEFSLYKLFWSFIPGLTSIRYPYRFYLLLGMILWIFIFMTINLYLKQSQNKPKQILLFLILFTLTVDNLKPYYAFWKAEDYLPASLAKQVNFLQENCEYFILDRPGGWWDDATKSMALSAITGVPTANGQSSAYPVGYPIKPQLYEGDISEILEWSQFGISDSAGCFVSDSFFPILSAPKESRIEVYDGFSSTEKGKNNFWNWSTAARSTILVSLPQNEEKATLTMTLKTPSCIQERRLVFEALPETTLLETSIGPESTTLKIELTNNEFNLIKIEITTDDKFCTLGEDPRKLFYEIKNYKIS